MLYCFLYEPFWPVTFDPQCVTFDLPTWSEVTTSHFFSSLCDSYQMNNKKQN